MKTETDLCLRMMLHAAFDDKFSDLTPSEVRKNLGAFFPADTINNAEKLMREGWIPPRVDLSFYGKDTP